ncbi:MAG TPA: CARDB domain-containing protein, partial [Anaerolineae bacterium]|nr:CARDB domain-containing protein [Anaerolineae bacterium]
CPVTGAVTAVWVKDVAGALDQRQFRLFYAVYQNGAWSAAQPIDAASTATDSEPTIVYQGSVPLVVWVRDADRDVATIADRQLAYRLLNGSPVVIPTDLPAGIVEPSAAIDPAGNLKIAFTRAEDANAFTGNQRPLYSAAQSCTPGCVWSVQKLQDNHGRALRAEAPLLTIDKNGKGTITFRGLGFGPLPNGSYQSFPEDAIGMVTLTGELAQVDVDFAGTVHSPHYLTNDGAVNWHPAAVFDPALNQINTIVIKGTAPTLPLPLKAQHDAAVQRPTAVTQIADEVVFNAVSLQPDFVAAALTPSKRYPELIDTISVTVQLRNDGASWQTNRTDHLDVLAVWDGEPGVGTLAGSTQLTELLSGQIVTVTLILTPPANLDVTHPLLVVINPQQIVLESTAANNQLTTSIGGLPRPTDLTAVAQTGNSLVYLNWTPATDRRVVGYRLYRAQEGGAVTPIGSTFVAGYVDLGASLEHIYEYTVTSYNSDGVESELSVPLIVTANSHKIYLPLIRRN